MTEVRDWRTEFKNKKITMMGLGLLGRGIGVAKFLASNGAILTVTDLKPEEKLRSSLEELKPFETSITYVLGEHRIQDFEDKDLIIKTAGVPLDSAFIKHAQERGISIEMDASLFVKLVPKGVVIVGITGTRGKSTTTHMIAHILQKTGKRVFLGGNLRGIATLPLLYEVKEGDYVVLELDSWQLQGFGESKVSPHIAVFTNLMPDHMNYYKNDLQAYFEDKANIFLYQRVEDYLIAGADIARKISKEYGSKLKGKMRVVDGKEFPKSWELNVIGDHNRFNAALAKEACLALSVSEETIKKALESFRAVEGRLQLIETVEQIPIYNDNNATTPEATTAGIRALTESKNIILIAGGADKGLELAELNRAIKEHCVWLLLLSGSGTERLKKIVKTKDEINTFESERLEELVTKALEVAKKGQIILFSPGFASFSKYFENEYERNDLFVKLVKQR